VQLEKEVRVQTLGEQRERTKRRCGRGNQSRNAIGVRRSRREGRFLTIPTETPRAFEVRCNARMEKEGREHGGFRRAQKEVHVWKEPEKKKTARGKAAQQWPLDRAMTLCLRHKGTEKKKQAKRTT